MEHSCAQTQGYNWKGIYFCEESIKLAFKHPIPFSAHPPHPITHYLSFPEGQPLSERPHLYQLDSDIPPLGWWRGQKYVWIGRWTEGQNPVFQHHCEELQVLFLEKYLLCILGGSCTSLPLKKQLYLHITIILTILPPAPGFLMAPTSCLVKCQWAMNSSVNFWRSLDAASANTPNPGDRAAKVPIQSNSHYCQQQ